MEDLYGARGCQGGWEIRYNLPGLASLRECEDCYRLVGENAFRDISLGLVCESQETGDEIAVQPGDVVGFYISHESGGERGVQIDDGYESESVWYGERLMPSGGSQYVGGTGRDDGSLQQFTNHAPILSVTLGT